LPKKPKAAANKAATDELATNEPAIKSITLESTNNTIIIESNIIEPLETSREAIG